MAEGRNPDGTWAKGTSGCPNSPGRPKSPRRIEGILQRIGQEPVLVEGGETITRLDRLMRTVYEYAESGNQWAVTFVAERTEGKIREAAVTQDADLVSVDGLKFTEEKQTVDAG